MWAINNCFPADTEALFEVVLEENPLRLWRLGLTGSLRRYVEIIPSSNPLKPVQVREHHQQYKEGKVDTRDVLIVAHGHFNRVLISRWINFSLCLGQFCDYRISEAKGLSPWTGTHFNVEPASVSSFRSIQMSHDLTWNPGCGFGI